MSNVEIMICSRTDYGNNNLVSFGNYEMMNFVWFKGAEGLYNPTNTQGKFINNIIIFFLLEFNTLIVIDPTCALSGFINPQSNNMLPVQIWLLSCRKPMPE